MRHLTHHLSIQFGMTEPEIIDWTELGQPIYDGEPQPIFVEVDSFAEQRKIMATTGAIRVAEGEILFTIADNEETRQLEINHTFRFGGNIEYMQLIRRKKDY
ncbi:hypothetical protein [Bacillus sp. JCM 19034]|uniref:hypothetical protein n=1 Tax=Bacillus sp. JCM 19034 TaxID=1481928 RepID=UPI000785CDF1|nr:hypothetical protein [Bacillus sp. JCM 19034]